MARPFKLKTIRTALSNPTRDGWKNKAVAPKGFRYLNLTTALPDIVDDVLERQMTDEEVFDKYIYITAKNFTLRSLKELLKHHRVAQARTALKRLAWGKSNQHRDGRREGDSVLSTAVEAVQDTMVARAKAGANKHFDRVEKELDKVHGVLAKKKIGAKTVGRHLFELDKFDQIGRRTYKMDDQKELTPQQWQVAVLIGLKQQDLGNGGGKEKEVGPMPTPDQESTHDSDG